MKLDGQLKNVGLCYEPQWIYLGSNGFNFYNVVKKVMIFFPGLWMIPTSYTSVQMNNIVVHTLMGNSS